jgi:hypothetical protein
MLARLLSTTVSAFLVCACGDGSPEPATVTLQTNLQGAELFIDGRAAGALRDGRPIQLLPGSHTLEARHGAQVLATRQQRVAAGQTARVQLVGNPPTPARAAAGGSSPATRPPLAGGPASSPTGAPATTGTGPSGAATVTVGDVVVRGSLSAPTVERVVRRHRSELRFCYERGLGGQPGLEGSATLSFTVGPDGRAQSGSLGQATFQSHSVGSCLTEAAERWTFPSPSEPGVVLVQVPLDFALR